MSNVVLNGKDFLDKEKFHDIMKNSFKLPGYYARNLDSLWDLLSEKNSLSILIMNADMIQVNLGEYGKSVMKLFDDLNQLEGFKVDYIFSGCFKDDLNFSKKDVIKSKGNYTIKNLEKLKPNIDDSVFIAEGARIIGNVEVGKDSSIWYNATLRADYGKIKIGKNSNIQDNAVIHLSHDSDTIIGDNVTVGHSAIIHGAKIENDVLVGMGAIVLDNCVIGENSIIGAGALVTKNKEFPPKSLIIGSPAKFVRELSDDEIYSIRQNALEYIQNAKKHKNNL
ncbi:barstar family protein [Helcococcus ovis]|uniref:barstar family protein n=1 Tax=Helcococcus ovis TaxID=72026 RepID=UPI001431AE4A|nr:barstar family protein [Helcococcus ovis]WNZ01793.1 barstar family protein [Helcococcus ovis]